jgi:hypothetical protein
MKRFTVIETLRKKMSTMRAKHTIVTSSLIVIAVSAVFVASAFSNQPMTKVNAPVVNAEVVVETTETTTEETTTVTETETEETTVTTATEETTTTTAEETTTETSAETTTTSQAKTTVVQANNATTKRTTVTTTQTTTSETVSTTTTEVKIVYKPSTHYFHLTSCKWFDKTCVFDYDINEIEGRICSKCHPDVTLVKEYKPPVTETQVSTSSGPYTMENLPVTQAEFYMLANLVAHEYGADWVSLPEKAKVVMTVMNRVRDSRFPNSIRAVILQRNQFCWVPDSYYWRRTSQSCKDAVLYYFNHQSSFSTRLNSFYGDGCRNHFYAA